MTLWRIRKGEQLLDRRGNLVAGSGELVSADHQAVIEHPDITRIACREADLVDVPTAAGAAAVSPDADPGDEAPVVLDPAKLRTFGRKAKGEKA